MAKWATIAKVIPINTNVSINAKPTKVFENNFSYSSGLRAVERVRAPNSIPVETAPIATGILTSPYVKHY